MSGRRNSRKAPLPPKAVSRKCSLIESADGIRLALPFAREESDEACDVDFADRLPD